MKTLAQQKAVAIAPKITALFSVVGSACTIFLIAKQRWKKKKERSYRANSSNGTYHRLILGMSLCDFSASVAWFCTTWPIPAETGIYGASGTQRTCSAQAFFAQFSLSTVMYNASLALYYFLVIVRGWKEDDVIRIEPYLHVHSVGWGLGTAVASLALTLFNQVGWDCWISAAPLGCQESWNSPDGTTTCVRGDNGSLYQWGFYYAPLWCSILLVTILMYWVYASVRNQEKKMKAYEIGSSRHRNASLKVSNHQRIAGQALAYVGAFYATWLFPTIFQIVIVSAGTFPYPLLFLTALFVPIQGALNLVVFLRPKYVRRRRRKDLAECFLAAWLRLLGSELGLLSNDDTTADRSSNSKNQSGVENGSKLKPAKPSFRLSYLFNAARLSRHGSFVSRNPESTDHNGDDHDAVVESEEEVFQEEDHWAENDVP